MKIIRAQQAKISNIYKNTKLKLLKINAAIWFNKTCRMKGLKPDYISVTINGNTPWDRKATRNATRFRINQEIRFLHRKKQLLNQQLYHLHLEGARQHNGMWQRALNNIDEQINTITERKYFILNKKLDKLLKREKSTTTKNVNTKEIHTQQRIINLTGIKLKQEQAQILNLGPNYAVEKEPKKYLNDLIIDTENAIRYLDPKMQNTYRYMTTKHMKQIIKQNKCNTLHKRQQCVINEIKKLSIITILP
jgi:hypothetical protein